MPRPLVEMIAALGGIAAVTALYRAALGVTNATTVALSLLLVVLRQKRRPTRSGGPAPKPWRIG